MTVLRVVQDSHFVIIEVYFIDERMLHMVLNNVIIEQITILFAAA